jgi:ankyrin repeat protein
MFAINGGHTETAKLLIDSGTKLDIKDVSGETALTRASAFGHIDIVKALIQAGAEVNLKGSKLIWEHSVEILRFLGIWKSLSTNHQKNERNPAPFASSY